MNTQAIPVAAPRLGVTDIAAAVHALEFNYFVQGPKAAAAEPDTVPDLQPPSGAESAVGAACTGRRWADRTPGELRALSLHLSVGIQP